MLQRAIHAILSRSKDALHLYEAAMGDEVLAEDVGPALLAAGLPRIHASVIGSRAEIEASHNALLTRWTAYQVATEVLTHQVGPRVSPERARGFGCAAEASTAKGVSPNVEKAVNHEARAGVSGATPPPKQADGGENGTHVAPSPPRESAGPNVSEARRSVVTRTRSDASTGSAEPVESGRRQCQGPENGGMTVPGLPGVSGRACGEGSVRDGGRPIWVSEKGQGMGGIQGTAESAGLPESLSEGVMLSAGQPRRTLNRPGIGGGRAGQPGRHGIGHRPSLRREGSIRACPESCLPARVGVGAGRSTEEAAVMAVDGKGLRFGDVSREEPDGPSRREA